MNKATKQLGVRDLERAAVEAGATLEQDSAGSLTVYQVVAPINRQWRDSNSKNLHVEWHRNPGDTWRDEAIRDVIERISLGTEPEAA